MSTVWEDLLGPERYSSLAGACATPAASGPPPLNLPHPALLDHLNSRLAGSVFAVVAEVEVGLRNRLSDQMQALCDAQPGNQAQWFDASNPLALEPKEAESMASARTKAASAARRYSRPMVRGDVIAACSFGIWPALLQKQYQTRLWDNGLSNAFPGLANFQTGAKPQFVWVAERLRRINVLRNRIAHHERVFAVGGLKEARKDLVVVAGLLAPELEASVTSHWADLVAPNGTALPELSTLLP